MQSTGQTSTQAVSLVSMHGSVMMNGMLVVSPYANFDDRWLLYRSFQPVRALPAVAFGVRACPP